MRYIKEPSGIDFELDPTPLTSEDRKKISEIIAFYKETGKKLSTEKEAASLKIKVAKKKEAA